MKDIKFTSRIISQLGTRLENAKVQALVAEDPVRPYVVAGCDAIFQAIEDCCEDPQQHCNMRKWSNYFRESKIELTRANLDRRKGNLRC